MSHGASIKYGSIEVNTDAWLATATGGSMEEVTDAYWEFDTAVHKQTALWLDTVPLFITARVGNADWEYEEHALISTSNGGSTVNLNEDMIIQRYHDPVHGPVALVTTDFHYRAGNTVAYSDSSHDSGTWYSYHDVEIICPRGHGWSYGSDQLTDEEGNGHKVSDIFPHGEIVTEDDDYESDTYGESRIICPTCGQHCDVKLPGS